MGVGMGADHRCFRWVKQKGTEVGFWGFPPNQMIIQIRAVCFPCGERSSRASWMGSGCKRYRKCVSHSLCTQLGQDTVLFHWLWALWNFEGERNRFKISRGVPPSPRAQDAPGRQHTGRMFQSLPAVRKNQPLVCLCHRETSKKDLNQAFQLEIQAQRLCLDIWTCPEMIAMWSPLYWY